MTRPHDKSRSDELDASETARVPEPVCRRCGGRMELGHTTALGMGQVDLRAPLGFSVDTTPRSLVFVVPGVSTSKNPIRAFQQGLSDEPADAVYRIDGFRCTKCGSLEFFAGDPVKPADR